MEEPRFNPRRALVTLGLGLLLLLGFSLPFILAARRYGLYAHKNLYSKRYEFQGRVLSDTEAVKYLDPEDAFNP